MPFSIKKFLSALRLVITLLFIFFTILKFPISSPVTPIKIAAWMQSANQGDAKAQFNLGVVYHDGNVVTKDDKEAIKWWRKSADQGNADAQKALDELKGKDK